jgi:4-alpha-glucanotransferase
MDSCQALYRLAELAGIETRYWDIHGTLHEASPATIGALLGALGFTAQSELEVAASLSALEEEPWLHPLPASFVARTDEEVRVPLRLPEQSARRLRWTLRLESGETRTEECNLEALPVEAAGQGGQMRISLHRLGLGKLGCGYHELRLADTDDAPCRLIVAPARCYLPPKFVNRKSWGIAAQLYSLKSEGDWGIGDFAHLRELISEAAAHGADAVGLNPLHALFLNSPEEASPYFPDSRLFRNPLYLDIEAIPEFAASPRARAMADARGLMWDSAYVDYHAVATAKRAVLEMLYREFKARQAARPDARGAAFRAYVEREGRELENFVTFQMLSEHLGSHDWPRWPLAYRDLSSPDVEEQKLRYGERLCFFRYLQWQCEEQFAEAADLARRAGMAIGLYNDLAVSVASASADSWCRQDLFAGRLRVGAPPDPFNETGQEWGVVPLNPFRLAETGYGHFTELLRANMRHAGALRIDHVMGWQRLFLIPEGAKPAEGAYLRYPLAELAAIAALESQRARCLVIGEDLGTVPDGFRERMAAAGVLTCRILLFERDYNRFRRPQDYPVQACVAATTHDLATLRGFWEYDDIAAKAHLGLFKREGEEGEQRSARAAEKRMLLEALSEEGLLPQGPAPQDADHAPWSEALAEAVHAYLAHTQSRLLLVQADDLALELHQANLPGSSGEYPNWKRRLGVTLKYLLTRPKVQEEMAAIAAQRAK